MTVAYSFALLQLRIPTLRTTKMSALMIPTAVRKNVGTKMWQTKVINYMMNMTAITLIGNSVFIPNLNLTTQSHRQTLLS